MIFLKEIVAEMVPSKFVTENFTLCLADETDVLPIFLLGVEEVSPILQVPPLCMMLMTILGIVSLLCVKQPYLVHSMIK